MDLLQVLSTDESSYVRSSVAYHSNCPVELLMELATDTVKKVRRTASRASLKFLKAKPSIVLNIIGPVFAKDLVPAVVLCLLQKANKQKALTWLERHRTRALPALSELRSVSTIKRETEAIELALELLRDN